MDGKDNSWVTPLHIACKRNNHEIAFVLLQYGANVTARDKNWETPAHIAAANGCMESMRLLLNPPSVSSLINNGNHTKASTKVIC